MEDNDPQRDGGEGGGHGHILNEKGLIKKFCRWKRVQIEKETILLILEKEWDQKGFGETWTERRRRNFVKNTKKIPALTSALILALLISSALIPALILLIDVM